MASEFELLRNVTIGQYIPTGSVVHRLDPRAKIVGGIILMIAVAVSRTIVPTLLLLVLTLLIARASRITISYLLRGLLLGLPILVFVFLLNMLFRGFAEPAGRVFFEWGWIRFTRLNLQFGAVGILRILCLIFITSLVTMTSTITELTHGVERLLTPLRRFGVPAHEIALINMIALRFVPTLAEEMERVMKAQASRGADFGGRRFWRPDKAARAYLPLVVPLFLNAFRRAEELILAMQARCYVSGDGRTKFIQLKARPIDWIVVIACLFVVLIVWQVPWPALRDVLGWIGLPDFL